VSISGVKKCARTQCGRGGVSELATRSPRSSPTADSGVLGVFGHVDAVVDAIASCAAVTPIHGVLPVPRHEIGTPRAAGEPGSMFTLIGGIAGCPSRLGDAVHVVRLAARARRQPIARSRRMS